MKTPSDVGCPSHGGKALGQRHSRQRQVILEELQNVASHPTAVELHALVRNRLPNVSLGTVYRNLDLLARLGRIEKHEYSSGEARFDANTTEHDHLRCIRCGRVDDLPGDSMKLAPPQSIDLCGYELHGHRLEFIGVCPCCREQNTKSLVPVPNLNPKP